MSAPRHGLGRRKEPAGEVRRVDSRPRKSLRRLHFMMVPA
jgi:hypothetical protein